MGQATILIAIGVEKNQQVFLKLSVNDAGEPLVQQAPVTDGAWFPEAKAQWGPWTPPKNWLEQKLSFVSRVMFFKKGMEQPSLVLDTLPGLSAEGINAGTSLSLSLDGSRLSVEGSLVAFLVSDVTYGKMPLFLLRISLANNVPPFAPDGDLVFSTGYFGDDDDPANVLPSGTTLQKLEGYSASFTGGYIGVPAVATVFGLKLNPGKNTSKDWRHPVRLSFARATNPKTGVSEGLRLVMRRYFELAEGSQSFTPPYYVALKVRLLRTTSGAEVQGPEVPAGVFPTAFVQEQPRDVLAGALTAKAGDPPACQILLEGISYRAIQQLWNELVALPYHQGIRLAAASQPISFVPFWNDLKPSGEMPPPGIHEPVYALRFNLLAKPGFDRNNPVLNFDLRIEGLELAAAAAAPSTFTDFDTRLEFPGLIDHADQPLKVLVAPRQRKNDQFYLVYLAPFVPGSQPEPVLQAGWEIRKGTEASSQSVRIGSLDLAFLSNGTAGYGGDDLGVSFEVGFDSIPIGDRTFSFLRPRLDERTLLPVYDIAPGGQDTPPGTEYLPSQRNGDFARPPALVFALPDGSSAADTPAPPRLLLQATEDQGDPGTGDTQSAKVTLYLRQPEGAPRDFGRVLIIDPAPFAIAAVSGKLLAQPDTNLIATWSSAGAEGANWRLSLPNTGFDLTLPPQAIAETMSTSAGSDDLQAGQLSDLRFSPLAKVRLQASPFPQRLVEPYWNLRRRLGFPGQRSPGSKVQELRFELLYGLQINVDAPGLQLAELQSRLGSPAGPLEENLPWASASAKQKKSYFECRRPQWAEVCRQLDRRLGLLELWSPLQEGELRLNGQVRYLQRKLADRQMRDPFHKSDQDRGKIAGGWKWGFVSEHILNAVSASPTSSSGELARPALSALGGWGWQKARFDEDRSAIIADTAMGRTNCYSLERVGRIAPFWNQAKHVVVYERTVQQRRANFSRPGLEGRPVLRKVEEYVEILEPVRPLAGSNTLATAFLEALEFPKQNNNNPRIPVDSAWGKDVDSIDRNGRGTTGWQVPLWRLGEDPAQFPKPHILLRMTAVPSGGAPAVSVEIATPELLRFYTSTVSGTEADPDRWEPVEGIDFADRPLQDLASQLLDPHNLDAALPPASPIAAGLEEFTFFLDPSPLKVNLTARRSGNPVGAALSNVVVMRGATVKQPPPDSAHLDHREPVSGMASASSALELVEVAANAVLGANPDRVVSSLAQDLSQAIMNRLAALDQQLAQGSGTSPLEKFGATLNAVRGILASADQKPCEFLVGRAQQLIQDRVKVLQTQIGRWQDEIVAAIKAIRAATDADLKEQAHRIVERFGGSAVEALFSFDCGVGEPLAALQAADRSLVAALAALQAENDSFLRSTAEFTQDPSLAAGTAIAPLLERIEPYRAGLDGLVSRVQGAVQSLGRLRLGGLLVAPADLPAQSSPESAACAAVRQLMATTASELRGAAQQGRTLGEAAGKVIVAAQTDLGNLTNALNRLRGSLAKGIEVFQTIGSQSASDPDYQRLARPLEGFVEEMHQALDDPKAALKSAQQCADAVSGCLPQFGKKIADAQKSLGDTLTGAINGQLAALLPPTTLEDLRGSSATLLDNAGKEACARVKAEVDRLGNGATVAAARQAVAGAVGAMRAEVDQIAGHAMRSLDALRQAAPETKDAAPLFFRGLAEAALPRALAEAPEALGQAINRRLIALHFDQVLPEVDISPVAVLVDRLGGDLKALGVRMPSRQLLEGFLPHQLPGIEVADLFPDFSGLKLGGLFKGIALPGYDKDNLRISHGVDAQSRRAWVEAVIALDMPPDMQVLGWELLELRLRKARFQAWSRIETGPGSAVKRSATGRISGDWTLVISGAPLVNFKETVLAFDGGQVSFNIAPDQIELGGGLQFLTDYLQQAKDILSGDPDAGISIRLAQIDGKPVAAEATLELPMPPLDVGTFGIANIQLAGALGLGLVPNPLRNNRPEFGVRLMFSLARQAKPFTLTVFVLGGGWLEADCTYFPASGDLVSDVAISLGASARLGINLGVASGAVEVFFGLAAEFHSARGATSFSLAIIFVLDGNVVVLGILSIDLNLVLEVVFSGDNVTGYGTLRVRAKLGPFFSISVDQSITYTLAGHGNRSPRAVAAATPACSVSAAASRYHDQLEQQG